MYNRNGSHSGQAITRSGARRSALPGTSALRRHLHAMTTAPGWRSWGRALPTLALVALLSALLLFRWGGLGEQGATPGDPAIGPDSEEAMAVAPARVEDPAHLLWVEETLDGLGLRQRVAQLVLPWIPGGDLTGNTAQYNRLRRWIEEDQVGGLIVSRGPAGEFPAMMNRLQAMSRVPLLIVSDLETGPAMRLTGGTNVPPAMALGATREERLAYEAGRLTGVEARAAGIQMTLGPVLDVNSNPRNPIINIRSFAEDPALVARMATAWVEGARSEGLLSIAKHFPGHGATELDSHIGLPALTGDRDELERVDLPPFRRAIAAGLEGVLVGHIAVPAIDGPDAPPASLSPGVIQGLLRTEMGFDGLVITDALNMGAVTRNYSVAEASIQALLAGADLLLQPPGERQVIDAIVAAVQSGRLPAERIDEAARRVLLAKAHAGLHEEGGRRASGTARPTQHQEIVRQIAAASMTLVRDRDQLVPLAPGVRNIAHLNYSTAQDRFNPRTFTAALRNSGRTVEEIAVHDRMSESALAGVRERAARADLVVISFNLVPREYRGEMAISRPFAQFTESLIRSGSPVLVVSFGTPYLLDAFPSLSTYLLAWSGSVDPQRAAAEALLGRSAIGGRLPISLPPHHGFGEGVTR